MKLLRTGGEVLAARMGQVVCGAASGLIVARTLGAQGQGHYSLNLAVAMLAAAVLNGGVGLAAVPLLRRGELALGRVMRAQAAWIAAAASLLLLLCLPLALRQPEWADHHLGWVGSLAPVVAVGSIALLAFDVGFYDLLAAGRLVAGTLLNLGRAVAQLALLVGLAATGRLDLGAALTVYSATQLAAALILVGMLTREARRADATGTAGERSVATAARLGRSGMPGQFSAVASLLYLRLNLALLTVWHGPAAAGVYSVAALVAELLWNLPASLSPLLVYSSADPAAPRTSDQLAARAVRLSVAATAAAAVALLALAPRLLPLVFGPEYAEATTPLLALLPGTVVYAAGAVLAGDFIGRGRASWNAHASVLTLIVNVGMALLLVPRGGIVGAAWSATVAYGAGGLWMVLRFRRATGLSWRDILVGGRNRISLN